MTDKLLTVLVGVGAVLGLIVLVGVLMMIPAYIFTLGWNWVAHETFGAPALTFWKSFAALWLIGIIGNSFRYRPAK